MKKILLIFTTLVLSSCAILMGTSMRPIILGKMLIYVRTSTAKAFIATEMPEKLEIEITEYSFAESMEATIANITSLRSMGVHIALDDFGTGYTSIKQLMTLPINLLKIDQSLIDDIETNQTMRDMVDSVIYMGHIMNCEVISEGVEKESQLDILREHKCDFIQGFVWGKPIDFENAKNLCQQEEF